MFNDEAHHIHDSRMAWFKSIQDIHHRMLQKDRRLALQLDVTATPRHDNGAIFVQTVSDYPLVEAIHQNVVKHPVLPDAVSRAKLHEHTSAIFTEKYADYLALGIEEWKKSYADHEPLGKKAVLFVMVDDTRNCDDVGAHLEKICPELRGAVLVIHTKKNGDISEAPTGKNNEELDILRAAANSIDTWESRYKAIVSVLMLKEGWDVRNVTTIVGLRAYAAQSDILPEQTLGRGLRRMYFGTDTRETVSVMGTPAFMEFVESIQSEGVAFEHVPMGSGATRKDSLVVEVDTQNKEKDLDKLDIPLPKLTRRFPPTSRSRRARPSELRKQALATQAIHPGGDSRVVFKTMLDAELHHTIQLDGTGPPTTARRRLLRSPAIEGPPPRRRLRRSLWESKTFMREHLFTLSPADLEDAVVLRNLSEPDAGKILRLVQGGDERPHHPGDRLRPYRRPDSAARDTPFRTEHRPFLAARSPSSQNRRRGPLRRL